MSAPASPALDLIDLKFLPAWLKEHDQPTARYSDYEAGEENRSSRGAAREGRARPHKHGGRSGRQGDGRKHQRSLPSKGGRSQRTKHGGTPSAPGGISPVPLLPELEIRFLPRVEVLANVVAQINAVPVAYSVYALARLFLQRPERYDVRVTSKDDHPLFRLGDSSAIASDRHQLESIAFRHLRDEYYNVSVTLSEPVKGNFTSVARERSSGVLLGPTNHHSYQPQLRRLYEQRFSRRMEFREFQRQIEIVTDPALVETWKEEARKITTFTPVKEASATTFNSEMEAERDFREKYLPGLISETREMVIDGVSSRSLRDRGIARVIENAWSAEVRSPSNLMQELSGRLRSAGLQVFRHRKGMLFVSPVRPKLIDETAVSDSVRAILDAVRTSARLTRKDLAEKLIDPHMQGEMAEKAKLALAADVRWLVREGHIVEFNDGALDLPRLKSSTPAEKEKADQKTAPDLEMAPEKLEIAVGAGGEAATDNVREPRDQSSESAPSLEGERDGPGAASAPSAAG